MTTAVLVKRTDRTASSRLPYFLCLTLLISATFLQKIAVPGSNGGLPIALLILPAIIAVGFATRIFVVNFEALACFSLLALVAVVSYMASPSPALSITSLALFLCVQLPLLLRFQKDIVSYESILSLVANLATFFAILAIIQFAAQFAIGPEKAFYLDYHLPPGVAMKGFGFLIPLYYGSPVLKSNGIFLAEPSLLSQFVAIGIATELVTKSRLRRLAILTGGLVCSYSGTGMMMLAIFVPFFIMRNRRMDLVAFGIFAAIALLLLSDLLQLDALTRRLSEFSNSKSSGFARFISIFYILGDNIFTDLQTFLLGRGPGTVMESWKRLSYEPFDPTWGKLLYEYGLVGACAYALYFYQSVLTVRRPLMFPLVFTYVLLGGYLLNAFVIAQMLVLVAWTADQSDKVASVDYRVTDSARRLRS